MKEIEWVEIKEKYEIDDVRSYVQEEEEKVEEEVKDVNI